MANLFMAFLGTNDYLPCTYVYEGQEVKGVRFVQEAALRLFCREWEPGDRAVVFLTEQAEQKNWLDGGHRPSSSGREEGLQTRAKRLGLPFEVSPVRIPEGASQEEIWEIFDRIYEQIRQGDRIVFDLTHAFRSLPLLALVVLAYAKVLQKITLQGIYYGAFEVLGPRSEVEKMPEEERKVPIFDLTPYAILMDWAMGIDRFLEAGDSATVSRLMEEAVQPILRKTKGRNQTAKGFRKIAKQLRAFTGVMATCRGGLVSEQAKELKECLEGVKDDKSLIPPYRPLMERLIERLSRFPGDPVGDGIQAARWCLEHNLVQQGYTILQETVITFFLERAGLDPRDRTQREIAGQAFKIWKDDLPENRWVALARDHRLETCRIISVLNKMPGIEQPMDTLTQKRNDLSHAGMLLKTATKRPETFAKKLRSLVDQIEEILCRAA